MSLDGRELHIVDEYLATVDLKFQRLVLAAADHLTELFELYDGCREIVFQVGKQPEFDLFDHVAGSEVKHVRFSFDFDPLIRLDERRPGDQLPQSRQGSGQFVFDYGNLHCYLHNKVSSEMSIMTFGGGIYA